MLPARNLATPINSRLNAMHHHGPIIATSDVVLARPYHVNRSAAIDRFHHLRHFCGPVRCGARSSPEAATAQERIDFDLLGLHAENLRSDHLIESLQLRTRPYFCTVAVKLNHAVHWFHRCVREKWKRVLSFNSFRGPSHARRGVSAPFRGNARLLHHLAIFLKHLSS